MAPRDEWIGSISADTPSTSAGTYTPVVSYDSNNQLYLRAGIVSFDPARIWIDPDRGGELDREQNTIGYIVHELLHTMGFLAHPNDLVSALSYNLQIVDYGGNPAHFLYPLDREALLAAYTRLSPNVDAGDIATDLGPWEDTSLHVMGVADLPNNRHDVAFGAAARNGFVQPWAQGPIPGSDLADNTQLSGTASWDGRMLGLTPQEETVAGAADLSVHLTSMTGGMSFTGLESWSPNATPGAIGTGVMWGDGDLAYTVGVRGNTFIQTGGGDGLVTGAFFGAQHEGMGGTLQRDDLTAAFGGSR